MPVKLIVAAADRLAKKVTCTFTVLADEVILVAKDPSGRIYELPAGTRAVRVIATPTPKGNPFWETIVALVVASNGTVSPRTGFAPWVALTPASGATAGATLATVRVSRFKEVTPDIVKLLQTVPLPRGARAPAESELKGKYGAWPPRNLDILPVPGARYPDIRDPVKDKKLNFGLAESVQVQVDTVVLELAGVKAPQLFGVTWPRAIAPRAGAAPMPTLLYFRQSGGQDKKWGVFTGGAMKTVPYPYNFDYAERCLFESMHYGATPLMRVGGTLRPKGVPYQIAKARKHVVAVYPVADADDATLYGVLADMRLAGPILEELQAFMFWRAGVVDAPATIGDTAMAFYSSMGWWLPDWLRSANNLRSTFLKDTVKAIYLLDTVNLSDCINAALSWAKPLRVDKRIRFYSRYDNDDGHDLMFTSKAPPRPYVVTSADGRLTAGVLPKASWELLLGTALADWDAHHFIPATVLTHAITLDF